jgi:predicted HAD superfamily hydrolase
MLRPDAPPAPPEQLQELLAEFVRKLESRSIVSFDVFDTALIRGVGFPSDLFLLVEHEARSQGLSCSGFHQRRVEAERAARDVAWALGKREVTLDDIYQELGCHYGPAELEQLRRLEMELELALSAPNPAVLELHRRARQMGRKVVFVSDMYLPRNLIAAMLERAGYDWDGLWVSCVSGKTKHDGELFDEVLATLGVDNHQLLHVGDNTRSDVEMPRGRGIEAVHCPLPIPEHRPSRSLPLSLLRGAWRASKKAPSSTEELMSWAGFTYGSVIFLSFARWLAEQAERDGVEHLLFLARDGFIMQRVYEELRRVETGRKLPPSTYVYASRRALNVPMIKYLDEKTLDFLAGGQDATRIGLLFERIGIELTPEVEQAIRDAGLPGSSYVARSWSERVPVREVFRRLEKKVFEVASRERATLLRYLREQPFHGARRIGVVDLGWHGTLQKSLVRALRDMGQPPDVMGYYFGLFSAARPNLRLGYPMRGFLCTPFSLPEDHLRIQRVVQILELTHGAPHGSVVRFEEGPQGVRPVFASNLREHTQYARVQHYQEAALEGIRRILADRRGLKLELVDEEACRESLRQIASEPCGAIAEAFGDLSHFDGIEHTGEGVTIAPAVDLSEEEHIRALWPSVYWRAGFVRRLMTRAERAGRDPEQELRRLLGKGQAELLEPRL